MLKLENTEVFGWEAAIRGMRNSMNPLEKSDSFFDGTYCEICEHRDSYCDPKHPCFNMVLGENDRKLMTSLCNAGTDHCKFMRMINVTVDITAPLYWYNEFDTYKVGTVANSCSTMHKIADNEFTLEDFSHEHLTLLESQTGWQTNFKMTLIHTIHDLNVARNNYIKTKDKSWWWQMIQLLPSSYNQKRTVQLNYQVLKSMYFARKDHKLDEWHILCDWMLNLPYFKEVCVDTVAKEGAK